MKEKLIQIWFRPDSSGINFNGKAKKSLNAEQDCVEMTLLPTMVAITVLKGQHAGGRYHVPLSDLCRADAVPYTPDELKKMSEKK